MARSTEHGGIADDFNFYDPWRPRQHSGDVGSSQPDTRWSFDFARVQPGSRVHINGHTFERVHGTDPDAGSQSWLHHVDADTAHPTDLVIFETDKAGSPTFANWGRVVLRQGDFLQYADPHNVLQPLGSLAMVEFQDVVTDELAGLGTESVHAPHGQGMAVGQQAERVAQVTAA